MKYNSNYNNNNNIQYTMISQDDLERERLSLINNNHHIKNLDRISCDSCSNSGSDDSIDNCGCCLSDSSSNSSDGQAMRTIKSIFYNNLFCKICLLLVCIIAIYTLVAIRCNGMGFDGCKQ